MPDTGHARLTEKPKKQAVVLIHGIGEQKPMATLWQMVECVWKNDPRDDGKPRAVYSEPDEVSGIFELRRLSTNENIHGKRTDFFEYYWAHLMHGNEFGHVLGWLVRLAKRRKDEVPASLLKAWWMLQAPLWICVGALTLLLLTGIESALHPGFAPLFWSLVGLYALVWVVILAAEKLFLTPVLGDAARYLSRSAGDIQRRQDIRAKGLALLEDLHKSGKYDRIVLVGHSLGAVVGYDLLSHMWGRRNRKMDRAGPVQHALTEAEAAAAALLGAPQDVEKQQAWVQAQRVVFDALRDAPVVGDEPLWLISDFVTLGAPLAHAQTLLAEKPKDFAESVERREFALNPPLFETFADGQQRFTYCRTHGLADDPEAGPRAPHNAAVFSAVRWTNIYFPCSGLVRGDLIGGPVTPVFGPGTIDIAARAPQLGGFAPHLHYFQPQTNGKEWGDPAWADHRKALRDAVAIEDGEACWPQARRSGGGAGGLTTSIEV
jgi:hypothetical protein